MPAAAVQAQQDVTGTLKKVDDGLRKLAECMEQAKKGTNNKAPLEQAKALLDKLQKHRAQIRQWATGLRLEQATQGKLAAARARIESEARRFKELERHLAAKSPEPPAPAPTPAPAPPAANAWGTHRGRPVAQSRSRSPEEGSPAAEPGEPGAQAQHNVVVVNKVLVEQVLDPIDSEVAEFICKICQTHIVGAEPKLTRCSHLFCGDCLKTWFEKHPSSQTWAGRASSGGAVPCPVCKEPLRGEQDVHLVCRDGQGGARFLWQMLSGTRVVCSNHPRCAAQGLCDWEGDYGGFLEHIRTCQNVRLRAADEAPAALAASPKSSVAIEEGAPEVITIEEPEEIEWFSDSEGDTTFVENVEGESPASEDSDPEGSVATADKAAEPQPEPAAASEPASIEPALAAELSLTDLIAQLVHLKTKERLDSPGLGLDAVQPKLVQAPAPPAAAAPEPPRSPQKAGGAKPAGGAGSKAGRKEKVTKEAADPTKPNSLPPQQAAALAAQAAQVMQMQAAQLKVAQWQALQLQAAQYQAAQYQRMAQLAQWQAAAQQLHVARTWAAAQAAQQQQK